MPERKHFFFQEGFPKCHLYHVNTQVRRADNTCTATATNPTNGECNSLVCPQVQIFITIIIRNIRVSLTTYSQGCVPCDENDFCNVNYHEVGCSLIRWWSSGRRYATSNCSVKLGYCMLLYDIVWHFIVLGLWVALILYKWSCITDITLTYVSEKVDKHTLLLQKKTIYVYFC